MYLLFYLKNEILKYKLFIFNNLFNKNCKNYYFGKINLNWGLGIGDWGLGPIPNPQSPIPNPQSPIPSEINYFNYKYNNLINISCDFY